MEAEFGSAARLRYIDFDSEGLTKFPEVQKQVEDGSLQPGVIEVEGELLPIYTVSYQKIIEEFERLGAGKISTRAS